MGCSVCAASARAAAYTITPIDRAALRAGVKGAAAFAAIITFPTTTQLISAFFGHVPSQAILSRRSLRREFYHWRIGIQVLIEGENAVLTDY